MSNRPDDLTPAQEAAIRMLQEKIANEWENEERLDEDGFPCGTDCPDLIHVLEAYESERRWLLNSNR